MKKLLLLLLTTIVLLWFAVHKTADETIVIYSSMEQYRNDDLKAQLADRFPDYAIQVMYLSTGTVASKLRAEGIETDADMVVGVESGYLEMVKDSLADIRGFSRLNYLDELNPKHGKYLIWESVGCCIAVNTAVLTKHGLSEPKTYDDLLKPVYRNLIVIQDPKSSSTGYNFYLSRRNTLSLQGALDYYDRLNANVKHYATSGAGPVKMLIQGECAVGTALTFQVVSEINKGNPLKIIFPPEGSPCSLGGTALLKGRENNPRVRKVFDWLIHDFLVRDKERFNPGKVLKTQRCLLKNYPQEVPMADMRDIENLDVKKELLSQWKF